MEFSLNDHDLVSACRAFMNSGLSLRQFCEQGYVPIKRSTFHDQIHSRLPYIDKRLYVKLSEHLYSNWKNRHKFNKGKSEA